MGLASHGVEANRKGTLNAQLRKPYIGRWLHREGLIGHKLFFDCFQTGRSKDSQQVDSATKPCLRTASKPHRINKHEEGLSAHHSHCQFCQLEKTKRILLVLSNIQPVARSFHHYIMATSALISTTTPTTPFLSPSTFSTQVVPPSSTVTDPAFVGYVSVNYVDLTTICLSSSLSPTFSKF